MRRLLAPQVVDQGVCEGPFAIYAASLYLAVLTITSVGCAAV